MKCILLCAGYATRLFPLTENFPKALLEIGEGKPLLDYILDEVNTINEIDEIIVITNNRYTPHFQKWASTKNNIKPIKILNDNTNSNTDRLGAIGDMQYTIKNCNIDDDIIVIAGDNLFDYKLQGVIDYYNKVKNPVAVTKEINDINMLRSFAVAKCNNEDRILELVEKPANPESNIGVYATYVYPKYILKTIDEYLEASNNPDAPGYLLEYVVRHYPTYAYKFKGNCYDVGTHESLEKVRNLYRNK
ncbi:MAG: sugar phosphate nucleotidyltransferase [Bacilli bacterium]